MEGIGPQFGELFVGKITYADRPGHDRLGDLPVGLGTYHFERWLDIGRIPFLDVDYPCNRLLMFFPIEVGVGRN